MVVELRKFQKDFVKAVESDKYDTLAMSMPRGSGKSYLAAHIIERALTPGDPLFKVGQDIVLVSGSLEQSRIVFKYVRTSLEPTGDFRWEDSNTRIGATHIVTNRKLRVLSSNAKTSFGIVNTDLAICDEPGVWEIAAGQMMWDSLNGALGKPGSPLKLILVGCLAPNATSPAHWWYSLVKGGTRRRTFVMMRQGNLETWDKWPTIQKANPLTAISPEQRAKLIEERDDARIDSRKKAYFLSYKLNLPSADESKVLLTVPEYLIWRGRAGGAREGKPIIGVDLGGGRAWSSAVAVFPSGLTEAIAGAPGLPDIATQEKRDRVPSGTYSRHWPPRGAA